MCIWYCKLSSAQSDGSIHAFISLSADITSEQITIFHTLTLKVLVATIDAQWEGMGDVGSARYEPALLPPMPDHKGFKLQ